MRDRCEASGLRVKPNADGRGHCPLCGDDWHCLTQDHRLILHQRVHDATPAQVAFLQGVLISQQHVRDAVWMGWPAEATG
jgi:hypothetical protein